MNHVNLCRAPVPENSAGVPEVVQILVSAAEKQLTLENFEALAAARYGQGGLLGHQTLSDKENTLPNDWVSRMKNRKPKDFPMKYGAFRRKFSPETNALRWGSSTVMELAPNHELPRLSKPMVIYLGIQHFRKSPYISKLMEGNV